MLESHEAEHDRELMDVFGITPNLEQLRNPPDEAS
jgi:hypothetical protein